MTNIAFIDGQNLYMSTKLCKKPWKIDLFKFRIYLQEKLKVKKAYYYIGYNIKKYQTFYKKIQKAGFLIIFRKHNINMEGKKKGNVDSDIIFHIMKKLYKKEDFNKIVLVSGDGDFIKLVSFLIEEKRFKKILFPNKENASSLYKILSSSYYINLNTKDIRKKIKKEGSP